MALLHYFQTLPRHGELPDPSGPLSSSLPPAAIEKVNVAVCINKQEDEATMLKRGPYLKLTYKIGVRLASNLVRMGILRQQDTFPSSHTFQKLNLLRNRV